MPDLKEMMQLPVVYTLPGTDRARVRSDLVYRAAGGRDLRLDVYRPAGAPPGAPFPAVLFVHGDGPPDVLASPKDWRCYQDWGRLAAAAGLAGITFNHRSSENRTRLPEAAADVAALVEYVRTHAADLGVDPDRLCIWTCSAGAPKALRIGLLEHAPFVRCLVALYARMDLEALRPYTPPEVPDTVLREYSPVNYLRAGAPPLLVARAGRDHPGLNESIDRFVAGAVGLNLAVDFYNHPAGQHAFDILDPDDRSRTIIRHVLAFMQEHLL